MRAIGVLGASAVSALALLSASSAGAVVINDIFASSIASETDAAQVEAGITEATNHIASLYSNATTVNILFESAPGSFLGESQTSIYGTNTANYDLLSEIDSAFHPENKPLAEGLAHLSTGNGASNTNLIATSANLRALGVSAPGSIDAPGAPAGSGGVDAIVLLSSSEPIDFASTIPAYDGSNREYSGVDIVEHEVDEVLGAGGGGSNLNNMYFLQTGHSFGDSNTDTFIGSAIAPLDRFRYAAEGQASFSTDADATAYFSLDGGATDLADFNQDHAGDFGDLGPDTIACSGGGHGGPAGVIQDAFACNNQPNVLFGRGSVEDLMLQSIGWNPVPEPETWALLLLGFGGAGAALRASRRRGLPRATRGRA